MEKFVTHILYLHFIQIIGICESVSNHENVYIESKKNINCNKILYLHVVLNISTEKLKSK